MRFNDEFVQKVLEANNLVDYISEVTQLRPSSGGFMGRCPFPDHPEKTPSFSVSELKQVYHCFGCGKSGNIFSFLRDYHGMSFPQAVEFLADRARIPLPVTEKADSPEDKRARLQKEMLRVNRVAAEFFRMQLSAPPDSGEAESPAQAYLVQRKLDPEIVKQFGLGYASPLWDGLSLYLQKNGVSMEIAEQAGLVRRRREGTGYFDLFRSRLMFPIHKLSGDVIGFGGRVIGEGEPKYLNSPESALFSKGKTLYGLEQTARYIRARDLVVIVEGYMDLLALFQRGIHYVAATLGTALTADHAHLLAKMTRNVVVLFDGDNAGKNAAEKSLPVLLQAGLRPKGLILPDGQDPDEFVSAEGPARMIEEIEGAPDLFNLVIHQWTQNYRGSTTEKAGLLDRCEKLFSAMRDQRLKGLYLADLAQRLQMTPGQIQKFFAEPGLAGSSSRMAPMKRETGKPSAPVENQGTSAEEQNQGQVFVVRGAPKAERWLLSLALKERAHLESILQMGLIERFSSPGVRQIFQWVAETYRQEPAGFDRLPSLLTTRIDDPSMLFEAGFMSLGDSSAREDEKELEAELLRDCVKRVEEDALKRDIEQLRLELKMNPTQEGMEKLLRLQKDRLSLLRLSPEPNINLEDA